MDTRNEKGAISKTSYLFETPPLVTFTGNLDLPFMLKDKKRQGVIDVIDLPYILKIFSTAKLGRVFTQQNVLYECTGELSHRELSVLCEKNHLDNLIPVSSAGIVTSIVMRLFSEPTLRKVIIYFRELGADGLYHYLQIKNSSQGAIIVELLPLSNSVLSTNITEAERETFVLFNE